MLGPVMKLWLTASRLLFSHCTQKKATVSQAVPLDLDLEKSTRVRCPDLRNNGQASQGTQAH